MRLKALLEKQYVFVGSRGDESSGRNRDMNVRVDPYGTGQLELVSDRVDTDHLKRTSIPGSKFAGLREDNKTL